MLMRDRSGTEQAKSHHGEQVLFNAERANPAPKLSVHVTQVLAKTPNTLLQQDNADK